MEKMPAAALAALLLAGCTPAPTPSTSAAPAVTTAATAPTPTVLKLGQTGSTSKIAFTASETKLFADGPRHVQAIMVKACLKPDAPAGPFSYRRWTAYGPDGERYEPSAWSDIQPSYPANEMVQPGGCVKGWVQFDTPDKLNTLRYANDVGEAVTFALS